MCIFDLFKFAVPLFELIGAQDQVDSLVFPPRESNGNSTASNVTDEETRKRYRETGKGLVTQMLSEDFSDWFMENLHRRMAQKLGIKPSSTPSSDMNDVVIPLLDWMTEYDIDFHRFFRSLSTYKITGAGEDCDAETHKIEVVPRDMTRCEESKTALKPWLAIYRHRVLSEGTPDNADRERRMNSVNPRFVLRNWVAEEVIRAFETDRDDARELLQSCLDGCLHPFKDHYEDQHIERWASEQVPEVFD